MSEELIKLFTECVDGLEAEVDAGWSPDARSHVRKLRAYLNMHGSPLSQQTEPVNPDSTWSMDYGGGPAPLPQSGVREGMRVLREEDSYCPECGHNRDKSSISTITLPDGRHQCQKCSATWMESPTPAADQVNTDTVSVPREPTKQMLDAGGNAHWGADLNGNMLRTEAAHRIYNAMLRAAQEGKK